MPTSTTHTGVPAPDPQRWKALTVIALAQLMVVLDATVVNIALPHAQADLHISDTDRQWVITAYSLAFGGLLLLGGRVGDLWGRKRAFITGLTGFALASALGGAAVDTGMLLVSRALQGVFGTLLAPAALSLLTVAFTEAKERARAFGIFGAIAAAGAAARKAAVHGYTVAFAWAAGVMTLAAGIAFVLINGGGRERGGSPGESAQRADAPVLAH